MFRFFRKIRQQLLNENKTVRYLKYAVGEVLLIMVGILLALQLSDWNQTRNDRVEEQQILKGLKTEFERQLEGLKRQLSSTEQKVSGIVLFMSYLSEQDKEYSNEELDSALRSVLSGGTWDPSFSQLDTLISSGRLDLIANHELRTRLANWKSKVAEVLDNQVVARDYLLNTLWPLLGSKGLPIARGQATKQLNSELYTLLPELTTRQEYPDLHGDLELANMLSIKYNLNHGSVGEIGVRINEAKEIITIITNQIR
jgi:hypothetical protein